MLKKKKMFYCTQKYTQDKCCLAVVITVAYLRNLNKHANSSASLELLVFPWAPNATLVSLKTAEDILQALSDKRHIEISSVQRSSVRWDAWWGSLEKYVCTHTHTHTRKCLGHLLYYSWNPNSDTMYCMYSLIYLYLPPSPHAVVL